MSVRCFQPSGNFYPRPPRGGRLPPWIQTDRAREFLSTPSARRATMWPSFSPFLGGDFYPRPPRGGRLLCYLMDGRWTDISIHALREEGDGILQKLQHPGRTISIHALREEGDYTTLLIFVNSFLFLSTPSARRATSISMSFAKAFLYFYPRPPRGGRLRAITVALGALRISIHALREEGDHPFDRT